MNGIIKYGLTSPLLSGYLLKLLQQMNLKVIVERGEDGYFVTHVPSLKSCWSQGKTREEALENIREAIVLYLEPEPTEEGQVNCLVPPPLC